MGNVAPQLPGLNRQGWERLEETTRAWAVARGELVIYTGPVVGDAPRRIGHNQNEVPDSFYKVVVDPAGSRRSPFWCLSGQSPRGTSHHGRCRWPQSRA